MSKVILKVSAVLFGGVALVSAADHQAANGKKPVTKPRPTHAETVKRQRPVNVSGTPRTVSREQVLNTQHRNERQQEGLMSRSAIISSSADWTLVPKGAVLYVPKAYQKRVDASRSGKLIGWQDFFGRNRSWIRSVSITIDQASGKDPLTAEYLESLKKTGQVLVAVCRGGPISVNLPKVAETTAEPADPEALAAEALAAKEKAAQEAKSVERLKRQLLQRGN